MGYVVLSGKMHVDKHDTSFSTLKSLHASMMLSFISMLYRKNSTFFAMFCRRPHNSQTGGLRRRGCGSE